MGTRLQHRRVAHGWAPPPQHRRRGGKGSPGLQIGRRGGGAGPLSGRAVLNRGKKKYSGTSFPKKARGHSMCSAMVMAVGGWWRLAVGGWRLAVGGPLGRSLRAVLSKKKNLVP